MPRPVTHGHGTRACYNRGCRRAVCTEANRVYIAERRAIPKNPRRKKA